MAQKLGLIPFQQFTDNNGKPAANGWLFTRSASAPDQPKPIFQDASGLVPYEYPTQLDDYGRIGPVYWMDDEPYNIIITNSAKDPSNPIRTIDNFTPPAGSGGGGDIIVEQDFHNHLTNGQFFFPCALPSVLPANSPDGLPAIVKGGWYFKKSNTNVTDSLSVVPFILGQSAVPANPPNYVRYQCTAVNAGGETFKYIAQDLGPVNSFSGEAVAAALRVRSPTNSTIQIVLVQNFGTGGAPSDPVETVIVELTADTDWAQYLGTITVPSVAGKTLGTNGDDKISIHYKMPLNEICDVSLTNAQFLRGSVIQPYEYQTYWEANALINAKSPGRVGERKELYYEVTENQGEWDGWFKADGRELSRAIYADLFAAIGTQWGAGDGSTTFNLPSSGGRSPMGSGSTPGLTTRTVGQRFGEEAHALTASENGPHQHSYDRPNLITVEFGNDVNGIFGLASASTSISGSGTPHNTIHPVEVVCTLIKFRQ